MRTLLNLFVSLSVLLGPTLAFAQAPAVKKPTQEQLKQMFKDHEYDKKKFDALKESNQWILLHFFADWCFTCQAQQLQTYEMFVRTKEFPSINLVMADYDNEKKLRATFKVNRQSMFILMQGPNERARLDGVSDRQQIVDWIEKFLPDT